MESVPCTYMVVDGWPLTDDARPLNSFIFRALNLAFGIWHLALAMVQGTVPCTLIFPDSSSCSCFAQAILEAEKSFPKKSSGTN